MRSSEVLRRRQTVPETGEVDGPDEVALHGPAFELVSPGSGQSGRVDAHPEAIGEGGDRQRRHEYRHERRKDEDLHPKSARRSQSNSRQTVLT